MYNFDQSQSSKRYLLLIVLTKYIQASITKQRIDHTEDQGGRIQDAIKTNVTEASAGRVAQSV